MDPALYELFEAGPERDEVSVILRLRSEARIPPGVRVISRFGKPRPKIVTARLLRGDIERIHDSEEVASMKAPGRIVWDEPWEEERDFAEMDPGMGANPLAHQLIPASVPEDGSGVVVGLIDYGFDFTHRNFRNADGTTRLRFLWDQGADAGEPPEPYGYGRVYTRDEVNAALATSDPTATLGYHPSRGVPRGYGAHGTHVADIMAGNRSEPGSEVGLASGSEIIFVHLATQRMGELANFGDSVRLLEALDFIRNHTQESPCAINVSAGKTGGPHDESPLFAQAVDALLLEDSGVLLGQSVGNYADSRMHTHARIGPDQIHVLHWLISSRDRTPNELEVWYSGEDRFDVSLVAPDGTRFSAALGEIVKLYRDGTRWGTLYHRRKEPNSGLNHIDLVLKTESPPGRYRVELHGRDIVHGGIHAWIERDAGGRHQSRFPRWQATSRYTTNTICNSLRGIAVGAYDATAADRPPTRFSSRGPTADERLKPEISAPGYRIRAACSLPLNGWQGEPRLTVKSGTSMAAPWVSGALALMQEAAGRPLTIVEARRLLIGTADPALAGPGRGPTRLGYGYLNIAAAVEAARRLGRGGSSGDQLTTAQDDLTESAGGDWEPRWVVDPQPYEEDPVPPAAEWVDVAPGNEGDGEPSPDGSVYRED